MRLAPTDAACGLLRFLHEGDPKGKGRPKFRRAGKRVIAYTPKETVAAEESIVAAWEAAGALKLEDGPISVVIKLTVERPASHFLSDGISLSAAGRRMPLPSAQKPDVDNAVKLVLDALNGKAWSDDVRVVDLRVSRRWGNRGSTLVEAWNVAGAVVA